MSKLKENKWYNVEDLDNNIETDVEDKLGYGFLVKFENGLIEFLSGLYFKGNKEMGHEYMVSKFMIIKL